LKNNKNILLIFIFSASTIFVNAQKEKVQNLPSFDQKRYHFGFTLGLNTADFRMQNDISKVDSLLILETVKQSGFNLGIVSDLHITPLFNLRFIPALSFGQRNLSYTFLLPNGAKESLIKPVESTYIDFPLTFKYRSERLNNFATYVLAGGKYSLDLASQEKVDNSTNLNNEIVVKIKKHSYWYEVGFGMDFFLEYFKFGTEIKYSVGINNLIINDNTRFSDPIEKLLGRMLLISVTFEG
jgi:hypothetical protein